MYESYLTDAVRKMGLRHLKITEARWGALDFETDQLDDARPVQIGLAHFDGATLGSVECELLNPERPISPGAQSVHGITDEMVRDKPTFGARARHYHRALSFFDFIGGYNQRRYDDEILRRLFAESRLVLGVAIVDPYDHVNWTLRHLRGRSLKEMCQRYGVELGDGAHDAGKDARAAGELLLKLVADGTVPDDVLVASEMGAAFSREADAQYARWSFHLYRREDGVIRVGWGQDHIGIPLADADRGFLRWALRKDTEPGRDPKWAMTQATRELIAQAIAGKPIAVEPFEVPIQLLPAEQRMGLMRAAEKAKLTWGTPPEIREGLRAEAAAAGLPESVAPLVDGCAEQIAAITEHARHTASVIDPAKALSDLRELAQLHGPPRFEKVPEGSTIALLPNAPAAPLVTAAGPRLRQVCEAVALMGSLITEHTPESRRAMAESLQILNDLEAAEQRAADSTRGAADLGHLPILSADAVGLCSGCVHRVSSRARCAIYAMDHNMEVMPEANDPVPRPECRYHQGVRPGQPPGKVLQCWARQPLSHVAVAEIAKQIGAVDFKADDHDIVFIMPSSEPAACLHAWRWISALHDVPGLSATMEFLTPAVFEPVMLTADFFARMPQTAALLEDINRELFDSQAEAQVLRRQDGGGLVALVVRGAGFRIPTPAAAVLLAHIFRRIDLALAAQTPREWGDRRSVGIAVHLCLSDQGPRLTQVSADQAPMLCEEPAVPYQPPYSASAAAEMLRQLGGLHGETSADDPGVWRVALPPERVPAAKQRLAEMVGSWFPWGGKVEFLPSAVWRAFTDTIGGGSDFYVLAPTGEAARQIATQHAEVLSVALLSVHEIGTDEAAKTLPGQAERGQPDLTLLDLWLAALRTNIASDAMVLCGAGQ